MTNEEKNALLQFMGQVYGQTHKLDQYIVGQSNFLKPSSQVIKDKFQEVLQAPTNTMHALPPPPPQPPQYVEPPPQPMHQPAVPEPQDSQMEFSFQEKPVVNATPELMDLLREINLNLKRVGDILEENKKQNVRTKKAKTFIEE